MRTITIGTCFVLFAVVAGIVTVTPAAFADHSQVTVEPAAGSGVPGCETEPDGCFIPSIATVDVGGVVVFSNTDNLAHTFTGGTAVDGPSGVFDSSLVIAGASYEFKAEEPGEVPYFCIVHPWMEGSIIVQEAKSDHDMEKDSHDMEKDSHDMEKDEPSVQGMLSDGTGVSVWSTTPMAGEQLEVTIKFADSEHTNYDVVVTQNDEEVLHDEGAHEHDGMGTHMTAPLSTDDPVDITITFQGYGVNEITGPVGEDVVFTNVVPEFGTIAMIVLAIAIISIIAVTTKSRVIPRL